MSRTSSAATLRILRLVPSALPINQRHASRTSRKRARKIFNGSGSDREWRVAGGCPSDGMADMEARWQSESMRRAKKNYETFRSFLTAVMLLEGCGIWVASFLFRITNRIFFAGMERFSQPYCQKLGSLGETCMMGAEPEDKILWFPGGLTFDVFGVYRQFCPCEGEIPLISNIISHCLKSSEKIQF